MEVVDGLDGRRVFTERGGWRRVVVSVAIFHGVRPRRSRGQCALSAFLGARGDQDPQAEAPLTFV